MATPAGHRLTGSEASTWKGGGGEGEGGGGEGEGGGKGEDEGGGAEQVETVPETPVRVVAQEQTVPPSMTWTFGPEPEAVFP